MKNRCICLTDLPWTKHGDALVKDLYLDYFLGAPGTGKREGLDAGIEGCPVFLEG